MIDRTRRHVNDSPAIVSRGSAAATVTAEGRVTTAGGLDLFWRSWRPPSPAGLLVLVHGLAEHSGRYEHVASWWPGLRHELLNEPEREQVLARIDGWLQARLRTP